MNKSYKIKEKFLMSTDNFADLNEPVLCLQYKVDRHS